MCDQMCDRMCDQREALVWAFIGKYENLPDPDENLKSLVSSEKNDISDEEIRQKCFEKSVVRARQENASESDTVSFTLRVYQLYTGFDIEKCMEELKITNDEVMSMLMMM